MGSLRFLLLFCMLILGFSSVTTESHLHTRNSSLTNLSKKPNQVCSWLTKKGRQKDVYTIYVDVCVDMVGQTQGQEQIQQRHNHINLEKQLEEKRQLYVNQLETSEAVDQVLAKDGLLRERNNELASVRRKCGAFLFVKKVAVAQFNGERAEHLKVLQGCKVRLPEKDREIQESEEQVIYTCRFEELQIEPMEGFCLDSYVQIPLGMDTSNNKLEVLGSMASAYFADGYCIQCYSSLLLDHSSQPFLSTKRAFHPQIYEGNTGMKIILVGTWDGLLFGVNKLSGQIIWKLSTGDDELSPLASHTLMGGDANGIEDIREDQFLYTDTDFNLKIYEKASVMQLLTTSSDAFVHRTPYLISERFILGSYKMQSFLINFETGEVLRVIELKKESDVLHAGFHDSEFYWKSLSDSIDSKNLVVIARRDFSLMSVRAGFSVEWIVNIADFVSFSTETYKGIATHPYQKFTLPILPYEAPFSQDSSMREYIDVQDILSLPKPEDLVTESDDSWYNMLCISVSGIFLFGVFAIMVLKRLQKMHSRKSQTGQRDFRDEKIDPAEQIADGDEINTSADKLTKRDDRIAATDKLTDKSGKEANLSNEGVNVKITEAVNVTANEFCESSVQPQPVKKEKPSSKIHVTSYEDSKMKICEVTVCKDREMEKVNGPEKYYFGTHENRDALVKILKLSKSETEREYNILQRIKHDNIACFLGSAKDQEFRYMAFERFQYTLENLLHKCPISVELWTPSDFPSTLFLQLMRDVVMGLVYLHREKIVYMGLNPKHVWISQLEGETLRAKLAEMGCSRLLEGAETTTEKITGSNKEWDSPELRGASARIKPSTDMFSTGRFLLYCLSKGKLSDTTKKRIDKGVTYDRLPRLPEIEKMSEAQDLIYNLLQSSPERRLTAAAVLQHHFLWDASKRIDFIVSISNFLHQKMINGGHDLLIEIENIKKKVCGPNWRKKVAGCILTKPAKASQQQIYGTQQTSQQQTRVTQNILFQRTCGNTLYDLLRLIRNKHCHFIEISLREKVYLSSTPDGVDDYFRQLFPNLLHEVYKLVLDYESKHQGFIARDMNFSS